MKSQAIILAIVILCTCYLIYLAYYFFMQRRFIFPRHLVRPLEEVRYHRNDIEVHWLQTESGRVESWYLPPLVDDGTPHPLCIVAHGNVEWIDHYPHRLNQLRRFGIAVALVEYPGYKTSEGSPSQAAYVDAFTKAYDFYSSREDTDIDRVLLFGRSLGSGVVCALSRERAVRAMILYTAFKSIRSFAGQHLLPGFLVLDPFDNLAALREFEGPVLIYHGVADRTTVYNKHVPALMNAARQPTLITKEGDHNNVTADWDEFWEEIRPWLQDAGVL